MLQEIEKQTEIVDLEPSELAQLIEDQADDLYDDFINKLKKGFKDRAQAEKELAELEAAETLDEGAIAEKTGECEEATAELADRLNEGMVLAECIKHNILQLQKEQNAEYDITNE